MKPQLKQFKSDVLKLSVEAFRGMKKDQKRTIHSALHKYSESQYKKYASEGFEKMQKEFGLEPNPEETRSEYDQLCEFVFQTFMIGLIHTVK